MISLEKTQNTFLASDSARHQREEDTSICQRLLCEAVTVSEQILLARIALCQHTEALAQV